MQVAVVVVKKYATDVALWQEHNAGVLEVAAGAKVGWQYAHRPRRRKRKLFMFLPKSHSWGCCNSLSDRAI